MYNTNDIAWTRRSEMDKKLDKSSNQDAMNHYLASDAAAIVCHQPSSQFSCVDGNHCKQCINFKLLEECYQVKDLECERLKKRCHELEKSLSQKPDIPRRLQSCQTSDVFQMPERCDTEFKMATVICRDDIVRIECKAPVMSSDEEDFIKINNPSQTISASRSGKPPPYMVHSDSQTAVATESSSTSSFEILDDAEFLVTYGTSSHSLSEQLISIAKLTESVQSAEVVARATSKEQELQDHMEHQLATIRSECQERLDEQRSSYEHELALLRTGYENQLSSLKQYIQQLSQSKWEEQNQKLKRQLEVLQGDITYVNKQKRECEDEKSALLDDNRKLSAKLRELQTRPLASTAQLPVVSEQTRPLASTAQLPVVSEQTRPPASTAQLPVVSEMPRQQHPLVSPNDSRKWSCPMCTFDNSPGRQSCEMCQFVVLLEVFDKMKSGVK